MHNILIFDPSGNFKEGKGTSGVCRIIDGVPEALYEIKATDYNIPEQYWLAHKQFIKMFDPDHVVIEGYRLYNHKGMAASKQANSELETPQLIGAMKLACFELNVSHSIQFAHEVKSRWSEDVLVNKGILEKRGRDYYFNGERTNTHKRDALKHGLHYWRYHHKNRIGE